MQTSKDLVKQAIVVRRDLNMSPGKLAAQVAHASMGFLTRSLKWDADASVNWDWTVKDKNNRCISVDEELALWIDGSFTKIVLMVPDEQTLLSVYQNAKTNGLRHTLITDEGRTEFSGVSTNTCVAVGPNYIEKVNDITRLLPLYR